MARLICQLKAAGLPVTTDPATAWQGLCDRRRAYAEPLDNLAHRLVYEILTRTADPPAAPPVPPTRRQESGLRADRWRQPPSAVTMFMIVTICGAVFTAKLGPS